MVTFILAFIVGFVLLWLLFVNVMTWKSHKDRIPKFILPILYVIAFLGYVYDIVFNIIFGTVMFLELPNINRLTLSARMAYIVKFYSTKTWRFKLAYWICRKLVEPWDPNHCGLADRV